MIRTAPVGRSGFKKSPSEIANVLFHYESDREITLDGSNNIQQWDDLSANGAHMVQPSAGLRFAMQDNVLNGLPAVRMVSGTGKFMQATINFPTANQDQTLIVVVKANAPQPAAYSGIISIGNGNGNAQGSVIGCSNTGKVWMGGPGYGFPEYETIVNGNVYVLVKTLRNPDVIGYINNVQQQLYRQPEIYLVSPINQVVLGKYASASTHSGNFDVLLAAGFDRNVRKGDIDSMMSYINDKYGLSIPDNDRSSPVGRVAPVGRIIGKDLDVRAYISPSLWLKADTKVTTVSGNVDVWGDDSGNGNDASAAAGINRPQLLTNQINGYPLIRFDGVNHILNTIAGALTGNASHTIFIVGKFNGASGAPQGMIGYGGFGPENLATSTIGTYNSRFWYSGQNEIAALGSPLHGRWAILSKTYNSSTTKFDARLSGLSEIVQNSAVPVAINTAAIAIGGFVSNLSTALFNGDIAEIIVVNRAVSNEEMNQVHKYLSEKFLISCF